MATKGAREPITLECTECKRRNYLTEKNKKNNTNSAKNVQHIKKQNKPFKGEIRCLKKKYLKMTKKKRKKTNTFLKILRQN